MTITTSIGRWGTWAACLLLLCGSAGCTFRTTQLDEKTGRFATIDKIPDKALVQKDVIALDKIGRILLLRTSDAPSNLSVGVLDEYRAFVLDSFRNMHRFGAVMTIKDMEKKIIADGLADKVGDLNGLVAIHKLATEQGDFLVAEYKIIWEHGDVYTFDVTIAKASDANTVLHIHHTALIWIGADGPLFYPVFNAVMDWTDECRAKAGESTKAAMLK
ncbi:MAG: hypothetical protein IT440_00745 [Phycisphaeraceae bacterium]|nr:hypothetical protein [Phycisphaeraceae bacterium]